MPKHVCELDCEYCTTLRAHKLSRKNGFLKITYCDGEISLIALSQICSIKTCDRPEYQSCGFANKLIEITYMNNSQVFLYKKHDKTIRKLMKILKKNKMIL